MGGRTCRYFTGFITQQHSQKSAFEASFSLFPNSHISLFSVIMVVGVISGWDHHYPPLLRLSLQIREIYQKHKNSFRSTILSLCTHTFILNVQGPYSLFTLSTSAPFTPSSLIVVCHSTPLHCGKWKVTNWKITHNKKKVRALVLIYLCPGLALVGYHGWTGGFSRFCMNENPIRLVPWHDAV